MIPLGILTVRWDPEQENELFLMQAATLAIWYHGHQIAVHRSFMASSGRESELRTSLPSAIICTNASRASIQVGEVLYKRTGRLMHKNTVSLQPLHFAQRQSVGIG